MLNQLSPTLKMKIKKMIRRAKEVIKDCVLENGAIVAANSDKPYYPREAFNYRWVWPRDACFTCLAGEILKMEIQEPFFKWLEERPRDFKREKLLFANYSTNGQFGSMGKAFQPDQMGITLYTIHHYYKYFKKDLKRALKFQELIERLANGLVEVWGGKYFLRHTVDLWEETSRQTSTTMQNNFTYSLAACARGLLCAYEIIAKKVWKETALQMISKIDEAYSEKDGYFYRNHGRIDDKNIDASLLGLVWPFEIYPADDLRIKKTIEMMEKRIVIKGGVHRYEYDYFDSEGSAWEGGGAWPALNFWMSIYWVLRGNKRKAWKYYLWVVRRADKYKGYLPEQIFDDFRQGIYPLCWSEAMFIISSRFLKVI